MLRYADEKAAGRRRMAYDESRTGVVNIIGKRFNSMTGLQEGETVLEAVDRATLVSRKAELLAQAADIDVMLVALDAEEAKRPDPIEAL